MSSAASHLREAVEELAQLIAHPRNVDVGIGKDGISDVGAGPGRVSVAIGRVVVLVQDSVQKHRRVDALGAELQERRS